MEEYKKLKILILGAGKMGAWIADSLCLNADVAVYDKDMEKLRYLFRVLRLVSKGEILDFAPDIVINAASLQHTTSAFDEVIPFLPKNCIISDISSVKNGLEEYYKKTGMRFCSVHPMFGPTFGNIKDLANESAIIIAESDSEGKEFFHRFFTSLHLNIYEYGFDEHDETIAYSLTVPFASTLVFASCMKKQEAPGTTFKKHYTIAEGLMSEDDYLISEILFNKYSLAQVEKIRDKMTEIAELIKKRDSKEFKKLFKSIRENI